MTRRLASGSSAHLMFRCHRCGYFTPYWARIERHVDTEHHHARIEVLQVEEVQL